jgi:transposase
VLLARLVDLAPTLVVLEATGRYELPVAATLAGAELPVAIVNPRQVRDFAKATGHLAKTDRLDAAVLAQFAEVIHPEPRPLPDALTQQFSALVERRRQVVQMVTAERHRLQAMRTPAVRRLIQAHLDWLTNQLHELEHELRQAIGASPIWQAQRDLLCSAPGIGTTLAAVLLADLPELGTLSAKLLAALVGELLSTRIRGPTEATGSSGVGELACARRCTWRLWWPPATIPPSGVLPASAGAG